jgi:hypothetical protein
LAEVFSAGFAGTLAGAFAADFAAVALDFLATVADEDVSLAFALVTDSLGALDDAAVLAAGFAGAEVFAGAVSVTSGVTSFFLRRPKNAM